MPVGARFANQAVITEKWLKMNEQVVASLVRLTMALWLGVL